MKPYKFKKRKHSIMICKDNGIRWGCARKGYLCVLNHINIFQQMSKEEIKEIEQKIKRGRK